MVESIADAFSVTLLAVIFLAAGVSKLRALDTFEGVVYNFRLLPESAVRPAAYALPVVELIAAMALLNPMSRTYAAWVIAALLGVFMLAIVINLLRGRREIDCGCFSSELKQNLSWWLVLRNVVLGGLALWVGLGAVAAHHANAGITWLLGGAAAVMVVMIYIAGTIISAVAHDVAARRAMARQT